MSSYTLNSKNRELIIKTPYIYKVFKIDDIEVLSKGDINSTIIYYRFSQDYGRTTSDWIEFTTANIKSERINPIRFFQIEYLVMYAGSSNVSIMDINLIGDFQNVSLDSQKSNLYGVREDCNCLILGIVGDSSTYPGDLPPGGQSSMLMGAYDTTSVNLPQLTSEQIANLYNPYQQSQALSLFNKLANDSVQIFGHDVVYIITDPDNNGTDYTFHEYQLQNYVCDAEIKVSVDNNQFPENSGALNNFDLTLFDTFEINITKDIFKAAFGVQRRPGINDVVWFCNLNKIYTVEHAQAIRNFNNYSIYYKIMLKKFNQKANIIGANEDMQNVIDQLTKNTTIEELMGLENMQDKKSVSNTEQFRTAMQDTLRLEINANIEKENIENASLIVAKTHYDLSTVTPGSSAVTYRNMKFFFRQSDNIGFMCWFNINNLTMNDAYEFFNYYDSSYGFRIFMIGNTIFMNIMNTTYTLQFDTSNFNVLSESTWYCLVVNVNQRESKLTAYVYKRNVDYEEDAAMLSSSKLRLLYKISIPMTPTIIEVDNTVVSPQLLGSDMKITNIRLFIDVIPETDHNKLCNLQTVGSDYKYVIFADHANRDVVTIFEDDSKTDFNKIRRGTGLDR